jgi:hypothetical protein
MSLCLPGRRVTPAEPGSEFVFMACVADFVARMLATPVLFTSDWK